MGGRMPIVKINGSCYSQSSGWQAVSTANQTAGCVKAKGDDGGEESGEGGGRGVGKEGDGHQAEEEKVG